MRSEAPLRASCHSVLLDRQRTPYELAETSSPFESISGETGGPALIWPRARRAEWPRRFDIDGVVAWGETASEAALRNATPERSWTPVFDVVGDDGTITRVLRSDRGDVALPFDPDDCIRNLLEERYLGDRGQRLMLSRRLYYRIRPLVPRPVQLHVRRRFARIQERTSFPQWPADAALDDFEALVRGLLSEVLGWAPPTIAPWPTGFGWALVLTHDVERARGYDFVPEVARRERELGFRSAFYFVPERDYEVRSDLLESLRSEGFEIGVHGLRHDGEDLVHGVVEKRLPAMRRYADAWGACGFRAPATHRNVEMMPTLGFDYDSSYSDTAPYEPQPGGTCALLPFFIDDLVELPITMPMDHTLFEILGDQDATRWIEKAKWLRDRGGMALMLTHPDYLLDPKVMRAYDAFLAWASQDPTCWLALPAETSSWWRARAATTLVREDERWVLRGPAASQATIR
jgi:hypothetical protein